MKFLFYLLPVCLLCSCQVQKRHYQKGWFISWHSTALNTKHTVNQVGPVPSPVSGRVKTPSFLLSEPRMMPAAALPGTEASAPGFAHQQAPRTGDSCDILLFRTGTEIRAKILEVSSTRIRYRKCDMPDGPDFIINKTELFRAQYSTGVTEVFRMPEKPATAANTTANTQAPRIKKDTHLATAGLIFSILGFYPLAFAGGIVAVICSLLQLNKISREPDRFGGEVKSKTALALGLASLLVWAMIVVIIVTL